MNTKRKDDDLCRHRVIAPFGCLRNLRPDIEFSGLCVVVSAAVWLPLLAFNFNPACDDLFFVLLNPNIQDTSVKGFLNILTSMSTPYNQYQPVTFLSFWVNYSFSGLYPAAYFALQLLLHLINVVLVYVVIRRLSNDRLLALITALMFGIHPLQVDTLAMIYERKKILSTAMALTAIAQYIKWRESPNYLTYATICILFSLALLADEAWLVAPLLLLAVDYYRNERLSLGTISNKIPLVILSITMAIFTLLGHRSVGFVTPYHFGTFASQCWLVVLIIADFIKSFFCPWGLSPAYTYSPLELHSARMSGAVALLAVCVGLFAIGLTRKWRSTCFGLVWFCVCIAPFSQIIPYQIVRADHYMYYALIGLSTVVASALVSLRGNEHSGRWGAPIVAGITIVLGPITINHLQYYQTPFKYMQRFVDTQGWAPSVEVMAARVHEFNRNYESAIQSLRRAVEAHEEPFKSSLRLKLANLYLKVGRGAEAKFQIQLIPPDSPTWRPAQRILLNIGSKESDGSSAQGLNRSDQGGRGP